MKWDGKPSTYIACRLARCVSAWDLAGQARGRVVAGLDGRARGAKGRDFRPFVQVRGLRQGGLGEMC